jgi:MFS transporter, ACS family, glucarate transporter
MQDGLPPREESPAPTRIRWRIIALLLAISVVTYIDRVNISVTARQMMPALGLTEVQMGQAFSAFFLGYALFQVPGGLLGDRFGPKRILLLAILWWSLFTACTALVGTLPLAGYVGIGGALLAVRFLIGAGESMALPNFNRTVANWLAPHERGLGIGLAISGIGIGSAVTPPVTAWIMVNYGWQMAFYVSALLGLVVAAVWYRYATDRPDQHPAINAGELSIIKGTPSFERAEDDGPSGSVWLILKEPTTIWLCVSYACFGYGTNIFMSWFYLYLVNVRGFTEIGGAWLASVPFLAMALSCPIGGWLSDALTARHGTRWGRGVVGAAGMTLAAGTMTVGAVSTEAYLAVLFLSISAGCLYFAIGAFWSATVDISKRHAATLSGLMNTGANLGGVVAATLTPWIAVRLGWPSALVVAALITLAGASMWIKIKPGHDVRRAG